MRVAGVTVASVVVLAAAPLAGCATDPDTGDAAESAGAGSGDAVETYEAQLLDGSTITIRAGEGSFSAFTDGRPTEIVVLDEYVAEQDCEAIVEAREVWTALADDTADGRRASAYAKHAANLASVLACPELDEPASGPTQIGPGDDLWFSSCRALRSTGMDGDYARGVDPEYEWYAEEDTDGDGVVCESAGEG